MPDTHSITLVKSFDYRGLPEEWSNTYHFTMDSPPTEEGQWSNLAMAIWEEERKVIQSSSHLVRAYCYEPGNEHSVEQIEWPNEDVTTMSGQNTDNGIDMAGDQAVWIRAKVGTSSTGKKVYIRKYYHDVPLGAQGGDRIHPLTVPRLNDLAATLIDGSMLGGFKWVAPQGATGSQPFAPIYPTTRTLKRRGKRPTSP